MMNVSLFGPGTVYRIVYFGPRSPAGRPGSIGFGVCWNTAGKNPAPSESSASALPSPSPPVKGRPPPVPGPSTVAAEGPLASAVVGRRRARTATVRIRRFIAELLSLAHRVYTGGRRRVPWRGLARDRRARGAHERL